MSGLETLCTNTGDVLSGTGCGAKLVNPEDHPATAEWLRLPARRAEAWQVAEVAMPTRVAQQSVPPIAFRLTGEIRAGAVPSSSISSELPIEELHDDVVTVTRLRNVHVVEKPVEHAFPDVQVCLRTVLDQQRMCVDSRAELERSRPGDDERRRKLCEYLGELAGAASGSVAETPAK
jgi:hypothetical protein